MMLWLPYSLKNYGSPAEKNLFSHKIQQD